jgi:1-aminocyclopropane-1-carboxylate deaminase
MRCETSPTFPEVQLARAATPLEEMSRLRSALGGGPRLLVKRDDAIPFGFGGNKIRKLEMVAAAALDAAADVLVTWVASSPITRARRPRWQ